MIGVYVTVPVACFRKGLAREYLETEPLPPPATCYGFLLALVGETDRRRHVGCRVAPVLLNEPRTSVVLRTVWRRKEENYWESPSREVHVVGSAAMNKLNQWLRATLVARLLSGVPVDGVDRFLSGDEWQAKLSGTFAAVAWPVLVAGWLAQPEDPPEVAGKKAKDFLDSQKKLKASLDKWLKSNDEFVIGLGCGENARPDYQQLLTGVELLIWLDSAKEPGSAPTLEARVAAALANPAGVTRFGGLSLGESTHLVDEVSLWERAKDRHTGKRGRAYLLAPKGRLTLPVWVDHVGSKGTRHRTGDLVMRPLSQEPAAAELPDISPE